MRRQSAQCLFSIVLNSQGMETMKMIRFALCSASTKPIARFFFGLFVATLPGVALAAPKGVSY
jgi:hypothetical protein